MELLIAVQQPSCFHHLFISQHIYDLHTPDFVIADFESQVWNGFAYENHIGVFQIRNFIVVDGVILIGEQCEGLKRGDYVFDFRLLVLLVQQSVPFLQLIKQCLEFVF